MADFYINSNDKEKKKPKKMIFPVNLLVPPLPKGKTLIHIVRLIWLLPIPEQSL